MGVDFNQEEVDQTFETIQKVGPDFLEYATIDFWTESVEEAPIKKGTLRGSIQYDQKTDYSWVVGTSLEYALPVHDGSKAHVIEAVNAQALGPIDIAFSYMGISRTGYGFFKRVMHPGTPGDPFFIRAEDTIESKLDEYLDQAMAFNGLS